MIETRAAMQDSDTVQFLDAGYKYCTVYLPSGVAQARHMHARWPYSPDEVLSWVDDFIHDEASRWRLIVWTALDSKDLLPLP